MQEQGGVTRWKSIVACCVLGLAALIALSCYLSLKRIYQVDELQNVFTARLLAKHLTERYSAFASLMFFGPMMWLAGTIEHSATLLRAERLLFLGIFWLNLCLIVRCAGFHLRSRRGLLALLLVATLAPLWDYGFEIRHDNLLLTAILLAWQGARPLGSTSTRRLFLVGAITVLGEFLAFKAFAYLVPIAVFAIVAAWWDDRRSMPKVLASTAGGAATGFLIGAAVHLAAGTWPLFWTSIKALRAVSHGEVVRFNALPTFFRLVTESPLLLVGVVGAVVYTLARFEVRRWPARDSLIPEMLLLTGAVVALLVNPTPFPYNAVLIAPQAALLVLRLPRTTFQWRSVGGKLIIALALVVHGATWAGATWRHLYMTNSRQVELMTAAEALTDPERHAVFDGSGLVPTRHPPGYHWLIHSFSLGFFRSGQWEPIRAQLARGATPVVIPNYRVLALPAEDLRFIGAHYVPLAGDFLVAGTAIRPGQQVAWECLVPGRYYASWDAGRGELTIDGTRVAAPGPILVSARRHTVASSGGVGWLVWLGPALHGPPRLGAGRAEAVFVNWY